MGKYLVSILYHCCVRDHNYYGVITAKNKQHARTKAEQPVIAWVSFGDEGDLDWQIRYDIAAKLTKVEADTLVKRHAVLNLDKMPDFEDD